jgi:hypothetical protein
MLMGCPLGGPSAFLVLGSAAPGESVARRDQRHGSMLIRVAASGKPMKSRS